MKIKHKATASDTKTYRDTVVKMYLKKSMQHKDFLGATISDYQDYRDMGTDMYFEKAMKDVIPEHILDALCEDASGWVKTQPNRLKEMILKDEINHKIREHLCICLEEYEDELENKDVFIGSMQKLKSKVNEANVYFPSCMGYNKEDNRGHIYVVIPGESMIPHKYLSDTSYCEGDDYFKVGKTSNIFTRMSYYPPMTKLCFALETTRLTQFEHKLLDALRKDPRVSQRKGCENGGNEYFDGDYKVAIEIIMNLYKDFECI